MKKDTHAPLSWGHILFVSLLVLLGAQVNISLFLSSFRISLGIVVLPLALFFWQDLPLLPLSLCSGVGVSLSRVLLGYLQTGQWAGLLADALPEFLFYVAYGLMLLTYLHWRGKILFRPLDYLCFVAMDYLANLLELAVRMQGQAFLPREQLLILLAALVRAGILWAVVTGFRQYRLVLLSQEDAERYQNLVLLIAQLHGEIRWMKRNSQLIEETMNDSYRLYRTLEQQELPKELQGDALRIATNIHEIKKEYRTILRGLSDALDLNVEDQGMYLRDLLSLLEKHCQITAQDLGKTVRLEIHCPENPYTAKAYVLLSVLRNLMTNALEAGKTHEVLLRFSYEPGTAWDKLTVEDDGPGIPQEDLQEIFVPGFSTKINYSTGEVSRGLGLNLVKDLVEHSLLGEISVASQPGNTCFLLKIPPDAWREG